jgi:dipeptidase D
LALFTDPNVIHGPIEAVFTVQEETTTIGAMKLSNDWIKSLYLINVDSEDDTEIIVGSGWSCDFSGFLPIQRQARDDETTDLSVKIMNGLGGHSATTIHGNHANIIVETFNILKLVSLKYPLRIIDVKSSTQLNAIPSYCDVILNIKRSQVNHFKQAFLSQFNLLVSVHQLDDKHLSLVINNVKGRSDPLTLLDSVKLVNLVCAANHGLNSYNLTFNIPNTSTNLGKLIIGNDEAQLG